VPLPPVVVRRPEPLAYEPADCIVTLTAPLGHAPLPTCSRLSGGKRRLGATSRLAGLSAWHSSGPLRKPNSELGRHAEFVGRLDKGTGLLKGTSEIGGYGILGSILIRTVCSPRSPVSSADADTELRCKVIG